MNTIEEMRKELIELIRTREGLIGADRKRTNQDIAELQHKIDCAKEMNNRDSELQKRISLLETAFKEGKIHEYHDWIRVEDRDIHVLEFEIEVDQA